MKRRRLPLTNNAPILPNEPVPVASDDYYSSRTSWSPSITVELALFAEY